MRWRLRVDIVKSNRVLIFPDDFGRNLPRDDFFENRHVTKRFTTVANNQAAHDRWRLPISRERSRQFPRAIHRSSESTIWCRGDVSHKVVAKKAEDCQRRLR